MDDQVMRTNDAVNLENHPEPRAEKQKPSFREDFEQQRLPVVGPRALKISSKN